MAGEAQPGRTLGRYAIDSVIGAGGFATVFRAVDTVLDRPVALKVLDPLAQRDPTVARRFLREGRAVASLDHHAIVPVYDAGEDDGLSWLAMRLIVGRSLAEVLDVGRRASGDEVVALVDRIGSALDHAHGQGVVHRDVKPSNILLEAGEPARAWLADFGIAATARSTGRYTTGMLGTAAYMAPEQARPREVGPPADIYSLGCVVYELMSGRRPFPGYDHVALLMAHANEPLPPLGDAAVDRVLARAMAKDPADRPPSGAALAAALRAAVGARPAGARPADARPADPRPADPRSAGPDDPGPAITAVEGAPPGERTLVSPAPGRVPPPPPPPPGAPKPARRPPEPPPPPGRSLPGAALVPRAHDPTVSRRGRSGAVRNLVVGVTALALVATVLVATAARQGRGGGASGTRRCDDAGVCFTVPDGWSVGEVAPGRVRLDRGAVAAAEYRHRPAEVDDPVAALAAALATDGVPACSGAPVAGQVGDARGAQCGGPGGGVVATVVAGDVLWLITVVDGVPGDEADAFVASFEFR